MIVLPLAVNEYVLNLQPLHPLIDLGRDVKDEGFLPMPNPCCVCVHLGPTVLMVYKNTVQSVLADNGIVPARVKRIIFFLRSMGRGCTKSLMSRRPAEYP